MEVRLHPHFQDWLDQLSTQTQPDDIDWFEVFIEVMALIAALEQYGRELGDPECHPIVTASYDL